MASGNLGELQFGLSLNDKASSQLKTTERRVKDVTVAIETLQRDFSSLSLGDIKPSSITALNSAIKTLSGDAGTAAQSLSLIEKAIASINAARFKLGTAKTFDALGDPVALIDADKGAKKLYQDLERVSGQFKDIASIINLSSGGNDMMSIQNRNAARLTVALETVRQKLASIQELQSEGSAKGYNVGSLSGSLNALKAARWELKQALGDPSTLSTENKVKEVIDGVSVALAKAKTAMGEYGREKAKDIALTRAQAEAEAKAKRAMDERASASRKVSEGIASLNAMLMTLDRIGVKGLSLGADTSRIDEMQKKVRDLLSTFEAYSGKQAGLLGKGGRSSIDDLVSSLRILTKSYGEAMSAQRELNTEQSKANNRAAAEKKRQEAEAAREAARAQKEEAAALKQLERESYAASERIKSLEAILSKLQEKRNTALNIGADTSKVDAAIVKVEKMVLDLQILQGQLKGNDWQAHLGQLGKYGTGQDVQALRAVVSEQEKVNREKQKSLELERQHRQEVKATAQRVQQDLVKAFRDANRSAGQISSTLQDLKSLFLQGGIVYGAQQFAMSIIQTGGEMERQHIALQSILGDVQNANTMFGQIKQLALESPFTFSELNKDVKQLAAYGVEYENLYDTTKRLADMSSGLGVSFERIALAFGQVQARGWLDGKELRQIAYAGIPLLAKLSELYSKREGKTVTTSEIKKRVSNREVSFDDVKQIFWDMTDVGGQFYNMQEVLAQTLLGRWLKLKDAWEIMLSDFASGKSVFGSTMSFMIDRVTDLVQALHSMAPVVVAAFSGFAVKKMVTALGMGAGSAFLASKGKLADGYMDRLAAGKKLTGIEKKILATRGQITSSDLRTLAASRAINKTELQRLLVSGKISAAQYRQTLEIVKQQAAMGGLNAKTVQYGFSWARVGAAASLVGVKLKGVFSGLWGMIGGLPGLILTGVTMAAGYLYSQYTNLSEAIARTQEELGDRKKQVNEFRNTNNAGAAIRAGNEKEIDNMIESYKEKIKDLAPYDYNLFVMHAEERSSHAERLKYLDDQLALMQKAYEISQKMLANRNVYDNLQSLFAGASKQYKNNYAPALDDLNSYQYDNNRSRESNTASLNDLKMEVEKTQGWFEARTKKIAESLKDLYGEEWIKGLSSGNQEVREAAEEKFLAVKQTIDSFISGLEISETAGNNLRLSILNGFGLANDYLKDEVSTRLKDAVEKSAPEVADKIRMGNELDNASRDKVRQLMQGCIDETTKTYPMYRQNLQSLLNDSNFKAVIRLLFVKEGTYGEVEKQLRQNLLSGSYSLDNIDKFAGDLNGVTSYYDAETKSRSVLDSKYNAMATAKKMFDKGKVTEAAYNALKSDYDIYAGMFKAAYGYAYEGTGKKGNKVSKKTTKGNRKEEDKELKMWRERLNAAKTYYQEYKKYKDVVGPDRAKREVESLYPNVADMDVNDYYGSLQKILGKLGDAWFAKSTERKKFKTEIKKMMADWRLDEEFKREAELAIAAFNKTLEDNISQFDLYKSLKEKTGSERFAAQAFYGHYADNNLTRQLKKQFAGVAGEAFDPTLTDKEAEYRYEDNKQAYELWKKIVDLVKNQYVQNLNEAAEAMSKQATFAEKIATINDKYDRIVGFAKEQDDGNTNEVIRRANKSRHAEINDVVYSQFPDLKPLAEQIYDISEKYAELLRYAEQTGDTWLVEHAGRARNGEIVSKEYERGNNYTGFEAMIANAENLTRGMLDRLEREVAAWLKNPNLTPELRDKLTGFQTQLGSVSANKGDIFSGYRQMREGLATRDLVNNHLTDLSSRTDAQGNRLYTMNAKWSKRTGLTEGAEYTQGQIVQSGEAKKGLFQGSLDNLASDFKALQDCMQPVIDLFDALGMEDTLVGEAMSAGSNALGAASSVAGGLSSLGLESAGPYGAAAAAALSITSSLLAMHDKALQKEIDASKERQEIEQNLYDNIKSTLDSLLGGVYTFKLTDSMESALNSVVSDFESGQQDLLTKLLQRATGDPNASISYYSASTYEHAKAALADTNNAYMGQLAALEAQRDELQHQRDLEADKKDSDSSALIQYNQQIVEAEQAVKDFADEFAESIYGINLKDWASQLTDAIVEAWAAGEDAVEAYGDKAKEIIKSLASSVISQMVMEPALKKVQDLYTKKLEATGKLEKEDIPEIGNLIMETAEESAEQVEGILDYLKEQGYDLSENSSSSTSKSIKSITEETADLLASYINSIRLDVSVNRTNVQAILESVKVLPNISAIAQSQLTQLNQLVSLASARNDKLDTMYDWMKAVTNGTKKISVA